MADLSVDLAVDSSKAVRGVKDFGRALDAVVDDLEDVERAGDSLETSQKESLRDIATAAKRTGKQIKTDIGEGLDEAAREAGSSGREAAASFGGGFEDVADFVQETMANALGGFGPLGAAAGVALAAGLGAALSGLVAEQERLEGIRDAAADLTESLYENRGELPIADQVSRLIELLTKERSARGLEGLVDQWADFGTNLSSLRRGADVADIAAGDLLRTIGGYDGRAARDMLKQVNDRLAELYRQRAQTSHGVFPDIQPLETTRDELLKVITVADAADEVLSAVGSSYDSQAYRDEVAALGEAWRNATVDASDYFTETEEGATAFDWSAYLTDAETTLAAAEDYKKRILRLPPDIRHEADRVFREQGAVAANEYAKAYETASSTDRQRFVNAAKANGAAAGAAGGKALAESANAAARATAQGLGPIPVTARMVIDDTAIRNYVGRVRVGATIVPVGERQAF